MLADLLSQDITRSRETEFGDRFGYPSEYFDHSVVVNQPDGSTTPRSPAYCATDQGVSRLVEVLYEQGIRVKIVNAHALGWEFHPTLKDADGNDIPQRPEDPKAYQSGGFYDNKLVAFLQFEDGLMANAAQMLNYFNHGLPGSACMRSLNMDLANQRAGN